MSAPARRASSRSRFSAYEPSPGGTPSATTSTTASERVAVGACRVSGGAHRLLVGLPTDLEHAPGDGDADLREQRLGDRSRGDLARRLARARALERVPHVVVPVLQRAGEIGMPGSREGHRLDRPSRLARRAGGHGLIPHAQFS